MLRQSAIIALLGSLLLLPACKPSRGFPGAYKGSQIHFGQGGGFSGVLQYYVLLDDGRLFRRAYRDSTFSQIDTWQAGFVSQMFSNYRALQLDKVDHYQPGDLYYFIQYQSGNEPMHRIAWGRPGFRPDENIVKYYNLLYQSTKSDL